MTPAPGPPPKGASPLGKLDALAHERRLQEAYAANPANTQIGQLMARLDAATAAEQKYRLALQEIMRVTNPGNVRAAVVREAFERATPARRIAREALGLPLGGAE